MRRNLRSFAMEADPGKRKQTVWEIERKLAEDSARPIIFYPVSGACCGSPSSTGTR